MSRSVTPLATAVAKQLGRPTLGIVSEQARQFPDDISPLADEVIFVPTKGGSWEVKSDSGDSYMLFPLRNGGSHYVYGGGKVSVDETTESLLKGYIPINKWRQHVFAHYDPDPEILASDLARMSPEARSTFDPTPLRTFMGEEFFRIGRTLNKSHTYRYD